MSVITIARIVAGTINRIAVRDTIRHKIGRSKDQPGAVWASGNMSRVIAAPAIKIKPRSPFKAARSAIIPPSQLPKLMPARMTPIMLVHVYTETPMWGARIRAAIISIIKVMALAKKTTANGSTASTPATIDRSGPLLVFDTAVSVASGFEFRETPGFLAKG